MKLLALTITVVMGLGTACSRNSQPPERPAGLPPGPAGQATAPIAAGPPATAHRPSPPTPGSSEVETVAPPPDPRASISGTITLPPQRRKDVAKSDIVYIIARRAGGPPGPGSMLGVQKHPVGEFPMPFTLSGRDAMVPGTPFEGNVDISVRLDKDGDAMTRRKGDLLGEVKGVKVGAAGVPIPLDTVLTEDKTLGAGMPGHGGAMPAMPPSGAPPRGALPPGHP